MSKKIAILLSVFFLSLFVAYSGPYNIAPRAVVTTSSVADVAYSGDCVTDGVIGVIDCNEWRSNSSQTSWGEINYPWIQLDFDTPQRINRVTFYDRSTLESHTAGGTLYFSDGSFVRVNQIPNDGRGRTVEFPMREITWMRFVVTDGDGVQMGLSEIEVFPSPEDYIDCVSLCDPYIESARGRYFFFVTGSQPFGMISAAPMTRNKNQFGGGYNYNSLEVLGFPQVHGWMLSGLNFMPTTGAVDPTQGEQGWKSVFSHDGEMVQPAYHRLYLDDYGIWVEQTATDRVSLYRMRFTRDAQANLLLGLGGYLSTTTMNDCRVTRVSDTEIEGSVNTTGRLWGGPEDVRIFFVMQFDRPFAQLNAWDEERVYNNVVSHQGKREKSKQYPNEGYSYYDAPTSGVSAHYDVKAGDVLQVRFAISYTSIENARNNMATGCDTWDFDSVRTQSQEEWNEWLSRIMVKGGTNEQRIKFYTDLWHVLLGRHKIDDFTGDYPDYTQGERAGNATINAPLKVRSVPKDKSGKPCFHMYNSDAFWLSQWNLNILWGLAYPEVLDDMAASLVEYDANGGLLPRGPNAGGYSYIMDGCPATNLIVAAYQKGMLTKVSPRKAYDAMVRNHRPGGMMGGKEELKFYVDSGYYPDNAGVTLEIAFQDWSLGQMAQRMGKKRDAAYYDRRSHGWTKLFHPEHRLVMPKDKNGHWLHNDPLNGWGWMEANAWQATWSLSHDLPRLAQLAGGYDVLADMLDMAFSKAESHNFISDYYSPAYISYANQPGCSNAHVFNLLGKPWLSQYWVRKVGALTYGATTPDSGYGGHDEDQGQMGGISALMAMGLFSVQGTNGVVPSYEITSPVFDEVTIRLNPAYYQGDKFVIKTYDNSVDNCYIQQARLNGAEHNSYSISHDVVNRGGLLEIWLGDTPNKSWGIGK